MGTLNIKVTRPYKKDKYTIGKMYLDGKYFCDTLEDKDRGLTSDMTVSEIKQIKVKHETAIPTGVYEIDMDTVSPKFQNRSWAIPYRGKVPRLVDVKGFTGVLIHVANKPEELSGCIAVGENKIVGGLSESTITFHKLMCKLIDAHQAGDKIILTIE